MACSTAGQSPRDCRSGQACARLALQLEDHGIAFGVFEGEILAGQYGAGTIEIWDRGSYTVHDWTNDRIAVTLNGTRITSRYNMIRFGREGEREWLLWRKED